MVLEPALDSHSTCPSLHVFSQIVSVACFALLVVFSFCQLTLHPDFLFASLIIVLCFSSPTAMISKKTFILDSSMTNACEIDCFFVFLLTRDRNNDNHYKTPPHTLPSVFQLLCPNIIEWYSMRKRSFPTPAPMLNPTPLSAPFRTCFSQTSNNLTQWPGCVFTQWSCQWFFAQLSYVWFQIHRKKISCDSYCFLIALFSICISGSRESH